MLYTKKKSPLKIINNRGKHCFSNCPSAFGRCWKLACLAHESYRLYDFLHSSPHSATSIIPGHFSYYQPSSRHIVPHWKSRKSHDRAFYHPCKCLRIDYPSPKWKFLHRSFDRFSIAQHIGHRSHSDRYHGHAFSRWWCSLDNGRYLGNK